MRKLDSKWLRDYTNSVEAYAFTSGLPNVVNMVNDYYRMLLKYGHDEYFYFNRIYEGEGHALLKELKDYLLGEDNHLLIKKRSTKMTNTLHLDIFENWFSSLNEDIQQDIKNIIADIANGDDMIDAINIFKCEADYRTQEYLSKVERYVTSFITHLKKLKER